MSKNTETEKKWTITFSNGYCGCNIEEEIFGTCEEAIAFADEYLPEYAESYAYVAFGWDEEYTEEEFIEYFADCGYTIKESEDEDDD